MMHLFVGLFITRSVGLTPTFSVGRMARRVRKRTGKAPARVYSVKGRA